ncbi:MAG TPA: hypothetical protein VHO47_01435 [Candidatus Babeliales bacterium]|nr:hypothetical protein [Candidatus Babeliales bacterium]
MKNILSLYFTAILIFSQLKSMEKNEINTQPIIIDYNMKQSIANYSDANPNIVGVFGATPRYSAFERFNDVFENHYSALAERFKKTKRLKRVEKQTVKKAIYSLNKQYDGLANVTAQLDHLTADEKIKLFLAVGINQDVLEENFRTLQKTAQTNKVKELVHVLLPSYFEGLTHLKNETDLPEKLHAFLKVSALFYQEKYAKTQTSDEMRTFIIIPPLSCFTKAIQQNETDKLAMNLNVVEQVLINQANSKDHFLLIDQNKPELTSMVTALRKKSLPVSGALLAIVNSTGNNSTIFHPYFLKPEKDNYRYETSPLINDQLVHFLAKNKDKKTAANKEQEL